MKKLAIFVACLFIMIPVKIDGIDDKFSSRISIIENDDYTYIVANNSYYLHEEGYPILPYYVKTYEFPIGTKIKRIDVEAKSIEKINLNKKVAPSPAPLSEQAKEGEIYGMDIFYPERWYSYDIGVGIVGKERKVIVTIHLYPVRYNAFRNEILCANDFDINIDYELPLHPILTADEYDLLIVCPAQWESELEELKQHKESHGIRTIIKTMDEVQNYNGRDLAEKLKYCIKDCIEKYGIKYVLLVGGLSSPIKSDTWLVPVRYSHLDDGTEHSYLTDLYFADIYKYEDGEIKFDDWDSNGNGIFAEWSFKARDQLDLYVDVYVGRLACRNEKELQTVIQKIITYEEECNDSWFKRLVLVGGDTFNDIDGHNYLEGEIANQKVAEILSDFEAEKIWWSEGEVNQRNVVNAIGKGCGFVHLSGHGSPAVWFVKDFVKNPHGKYIWALDVYHIPLLKNGNKLPIVVIGGCHNSMFNTSLYKSTKEVIVTIIIKYILGKPYTTWYWIPAPECMGWWFVKQEGGGAIATFGCTGLGLGTIGDNNNDGIPDCIQYLLTWLELRFFEVYANGVDILGETWGNAINDYVATFLTEKKLSADIKTVQEWVLLGDPTLKIGGYH